jgi:hypothetical protein
MDRHKDSAFNNHRSSAAHGPSRDGNQRMTHMAGPRLAPGSGQEILDVNRHRDGEASSRRSSAAHGPSGDGNRRMTHMAGPRLAPGSGQEILDVNRHRDGEASNHRSSAVHGSTRDRNQEVLVAAQHSSAALRLQNVTDSVRLAVRTDPHTPSHTDEDIQHNQPDIHGALSRSATDSVSHHGTTSIQSAQNTRVDIQPAYGYAHQNRRQSDRRDKTSVQSSQPGASSVLHSTTTQRTSVHATTASSERTRSYEDRNKPQSHSVMQSGQESNVGGPARNEERHKESGSSKSLGLSGASTKSTKRQRVITDFILTDKGVPFVTPILSDSIPSQPGLGPDSTTHGSKESVSTNEQHSGLELSTTPELITTFRSMEMEDIEDMLLGRNVHIELSKFIITRVR